MNHETAIIEQVNSARDRSLKSASASWRSAKVEAERSKHHELRAMNYLREVGLSLQLASGHCQITMQFFSNAKSKLPKSMGYSQARVCCNVATSFPEKIESDSDVNKLRETWRQCLLDEQPEKRMEKQNARPFNPWSDFVSYVNGIDKIFSEISADKMSDWRDDQLRKFIETTNAIDQKRIEAETILAERRCTSSPLQNEPTQ